MLRIFNEKDNVVDRALQLLHFCWRILDPIEQLAALLAARSTTSAKPTTAKELATSENGSAIVQDEPIRKARQNASRESKGMKKECGVKKR
jgi:hypothetical protein